MDIKNKIITVEDLGLLSFASALEVQEDYFYKIISEKKANRQKEQPTPTDNFLLFVEHKPVYTLGKSGDIQHLLLDQNGLKEKEIEFSQDESWRGHYFPWIGSDRWIPHFRFR